MMGCYSSAAEARQRSLMGAAADAHVRVLSVRCLSRSHHGSRQAARVVCRRRSNR